MEGNEFVSNDQWNEHFALSDFHYSLINGCWLGNMFQTFYFSELECDEIVSNVKGGCVLGVRSHCGERMRKMRRIISL